MFYTLEDNHRYVVVTETEARNYIEEWSQTTEEGEDAFDVWLNDHYTAADIYRQYDNSEFMNGLIDQFIDDAILESLCDDINPVDISEDAMKEIVRVYNEKDNVNN